MIGMPHMTRSIFRKPKTLCRTVSLPEVIQGRTNIALRICLRNNADRIRRASYTGGALMNKKLHRFCCLQTSTSCSKSNISPMGVPINAIKSSWSPYFIDVRPSSANIPHTGRETKGAWTHGTFIPCWPRL